MLVREAMHVALKSVNAALDQDAASTAAVAITASDVYVSGGTRNATLRKASMDAFRVGQTIVSGPMFHALHAASAASGAAFLHPPGDTTDAHQTKHILGAAVHFVLCHEVSARESVAAIDAVVKRAPDEIKELLRMYPQPVGGKQRYGAVQVMLYIAITQSE